MFAAQPRLSRSGMTLVEMLVAMAVTLVMMSAVVQIFGLIGDNVAKSRAASEMSDQLRATINRVQQDLDNCTVRTLADSAWTSPDSEQGYFEYVEGPGTDYYPDQTGVLGNPQNFVNGAVNTSGNPPIFGVVGDMDDILILTVRNEEQPFIVNLYEKLPTDPPGLPNPPVIETPYAEVVYWVNVSVAEAGAKGASGIGPVGTLMRQVRPLVPAHMLSEEALSRALARLGGNSTRFRSLTTCSVRPSRNWSVDAGPHVFNTLGDLSKPENRSWRAYETPTQQATDVSVFPYPPVQDAWSPVGLVPYLPVDPRHGTDVVLRNVKAFDVKVWDPNAPVLEVQDSAGRWVLRQPNDPKTDALPDYLEALQIVATSGQKARVVKSGAFVDLYYLRGLPGYLIGQEPDTWKKNWTDDFVNQYLPPPHFGFPPASAIAGRAREANLTPAAPYFSTWTTAYESNGWDENMNSLVDEGTDGRDNNGIGGPDDASERETRPPYDAPLRGVEVTVRVVEPDTGQVRQSTLVGEFTK